MVAFFATASSEQAKILCKPTQETHDNGISGLRCAKKRNPRLRAENDALTDVDVSDGCVDAHVSDGDADTYRM
jgi:hypothetical protein